MKKTRFVVYILSSIFFEYYKCAKWGWVSASMVKKVQNEELNGVGGVMFMDIFCNIWKKLGGWVSGGHLQIFSSSVPQFFS